MRQTKFHIHTQQFLISNFRREEAYTTYEDETISVPKRRYINSDAGESPKWKNTTKL